MRRGLYTVEFEPVVQIGDLVKLLPEDVFRGAIYEVKKIVPYPVAAVVDLGAISANSEMNSYKEVDRLKLPPNWFGQWRLRLIDDFVLSEMRYRGRAGTTFWALKERLGYLTKTTDREWIAEIFTFQDDKLYIKGKNIHGFDLPKARIEVSGYTFKVSIKTEPVEKPYTRIPIGALEVE